MSYYNNCNMANQSKNHMNTSNKWSELSYVCETRVPQGEEVLSYTWPLCFLKRNKNNLFTNNYGQLVPLNIKEPDLTLDLESEFDYVVDVQRNLTPLQVKIAKYWGDGPPTKQFMPIADILIDTYSVPAPRAGRILYILNGAINDAFIVAWDLKYKWDILRPCQYDQNFIPLLCTPKHPTYPSGHSVTAGCMAYILSYFFPAEKEKLFALAQECSDSRIYGGVHFRADCDEGLKLGMSIAKAIIDDIYNECNGNSVKIDIPYTEYEDAKIYPKTHEQYIPYDRDNTCSSCTLYNASYSCSCSSCSSCSSSNCYYRK